MGKQGANLVQADISHRVIGGFFDTYNELGYGFPEFVCRSALLVTLRQLHLNVEAEVPLPVWFRGERIANFRGDMLVNSVLLVEVKALQELERFHYAQVLHYLKASGLEVGLLLNFGPRPQFKRIVFQRERVASAVLHPQRAGREAEEQCDCSKSAMIHVPRRTDV
jgi:GxxExxY protein